MSRSGACGNCSDPLVGPGRQVEVEGKIQRWCDDCASDRDERRAELELEQLHGVYKGEDAMGQPRYESFYSDADGQWYWRQVGGNGEITARSSEGYESKQHADRGIDDAIAEAVKVSQEREAEHQAASEAAGEQAAGDAEAG